MQRPRRRTSSRPAQPQHRPHYRCRRRALSPLRPLPPRRPLELPPRRPLQPRRPPRCSCAARRKPKGRKPSCAVARCRRLPPRTRDASDQQTLLHAAQQQKLNFGVRRDGAAIGLSQTCSDRLGERQRRTAEHDTALTEGLPVHQATAITVRLPLLSPQTQDARMPTWPAQRCEGAKVFVRTVRSF